MNSKHCVKLLIGHKLMLAAVIPFFAFSSAQAQTPDDNKIWTTVGSDGTVDETDTGKVFFDRSVVQMGHPLVNAPAAKKAKAAVIPTQTQSAVIRYNVTPVDGLFAPTQLCEPGSGCSGIQLKLRYLDTGGNAQVVARLIEVNLATGAETTRLNFNSNAFPASNGYQVQSTGVCGPLWRFDFKGKAYYVQATLTHSSILANSAAGIQMIKIDNTPCLG